jgi:hypothetical protein
MAISKKTEQINSLGMAQANLEYATKELRAAQANFEKASDRLSLAEEGHQMAITELVGEVGVVRSKARVVPTSLK